MICPFYLGKAGILALCSEQQIPALFCILDLGLMFTVLLSGPCTMRCQWPTISQGACAAAYSPCYHPHFASTAGVVATFRLLFGFCFVLFLFVCLLGCLFACLCVCVFSGLTRRKLGRSLKKAVPVSVVGVIDYQGAQDIFKGMLARFLVATDNFSLTKAVDSVTMTIA